MPQPLFFKQCFVISYIVDQGFSADCRWLLTLDFVKQVGGDLLDIAVERRRCLLIVRAISLRAISLRAISRRARFVASNINNILG